MAGNRVRVGKRWPVELDDIVKSGVRQKHDNSDRADGNSQPQNQAAVMLLELSRR